ncbi:hypothetical protein B9G54_01610 [Alloscardovia macacae]|uniref:Uncharacterized protein n=1 Tax=Alloscardovia macacae TaxID=1160091 RepID=A0A1Y2T0H5_9BIFI|nr:hypothetical protein [Alloscardovia macacae]OTA27243.1 hypothetical protein B9G54_01610 [Alloscardovia macacae]OTA29253.1 hypothetical protein B9T39_03805 [Alloscardovia macacae]
MVRNEDFKEQSEFTKSVAAFVRERMSERGLTTQNVADRIKHAKSYAYNRIQGNQSFTLDDLIELSPALGFKDVYAFMRALDTYQRYEAAKARDPKPQTESVAPQRKPLPPAPQAEIDDLEARLARSQARINQLKDYQIVADRSEREDEEFYD